MLRGRRLALVTAVCALAVTVGAATAAAHVESSSGTQASTVKVGIVYSRTGLLAAYGAQYVDGLRLGLG